MPRRLRLAFEDASALRAELERNIGNGGAFVPGAEPCELREIVEVELDFRFCDEQLTLEAEVVHVVPGTSGCDLAVQFLCPASELRETIVDLLGRAGADGARDEVWELERDEPGPTRAAAPAPAREAGGAGK
ncbi:MAG: PilZ domain-containing protein, partial [Myxococcota bacterium]|nr:PilZ domain-containing protein [Myxococcota bacterium]